MSAIPLTIHVENSYATGATFTHTLTVDVPAPEPGVDLDDWGIDELLRFTGEGPQYAGTHAVYEVEILSAPAEYPHLVGLTVTAEG